MKTYFVISDVHSFYKEMKDALLLAGFRKSNPDHILIVIGDLFDRGPDTLKVYTYIHSLPKNRRIMIKGNHEQLYLDLLLKKRPESHDFHNHTVSTFCQIANEEEWKLDAFKYYDARFDGFEDFKKSSLTWSKIKEKVKNHPITKWIQSKEWVDYYELDNFIFTHSFIPTKLKDNYNHLKWYPASELNPSYFEYDPDWRNSWFGDAIWGCPFTQYKEGLFQPEEDNGKQLVVGHWHTAEFYKHLKNIYIDSPAPIYYSKGLIGIDGGCMYNGYTKEFIHPQNVLVIKNGKCYDKYGDPLMEPIANRRIETVTLTEEEYKKLKD